jgi:hypothetical protein
MDLTMDYRMESFVAALGELPLAARRLDDSEARHHTATWIRRLLGKGIAGQYVIAYQHGKRWWTFCFERECDSTLETGTDELWTVEAYDSMRGSWCETFRFNPHTSEWERQARVMHAPSRTPAPARGRQDRPR